jgi:LEA14-like dessication related protein
MKIIPVLALVAGVGALIYFSNLGVGANDLQILLNNVQIRGVTDIQITLMVQNVSNATLNIKSMTGTVTLNGSTLGNISSFQKVDVLPNSQQPITVTLNPSLIALPGIVQTLLQGSGKQLEFVVEGNVNLNSLVVPFSVSDTINY